MNKQIEFAKLNHIKIDNEILRDRVGEVLETFFLNKDAGTDIEEITSLLYNYDVMKETEVARLETFLERIGKSLWKSANEYDKAKIEERLNVPKKKNNRSKRK
jgi:hypothetical protein|tara:strand:- start:151 stop:459 length:309 start_codon:yes stop_codon:yes gene_type:complete